MTALVSRALPRTPPDPPGAIVGYHQEYANAVAAAQPQGAYPGGSGAPGLVAVNFRISDEDFESLSAYLGLLRRLLERVRGSAYPAGVPTEHPL